ncbi:ABC transporter ATP-binding protein [Kiloniella laminariae]|uniref:ABC transporter ATP-binding protein n=1 Tax=Kiloniella laminariae TaxID=454162 RepID=A0ABT4LPQ6_9PROT|nr:ABC transporter ATP-binding protein [Kiloniella laminariae]MCZ4283064.1 ABC transporter ATP-binding protein [Kiloniella laminariae]
MNNALEINNLSIHYQTDSGEVRALRNVNLKVPDGKVVGIVGESGCGKSTLMSAIINLLSENAIVKNGKILFENTDILTMSKHRLRKLRGYDIATVFQDPMTTFNPVMTIGQQLTDFQHRFKERNRQQKRQKIIEMFELVGIPDPAQRLNQFPHEFSGGMRQRMAIAAALLMNPRLLVADEPTTALDVTMEAQILHLLRKMKNDFNGSILIITHHLGVVAELCDYITVMYAGEVVEQGTVEDIFYRPSHPYTKALLECDPAVLKRKTRYLPTIKGRIPDLRTPPPGCVFANRCSKVSAQCTQTAPPVVDLSDGNHWCICHEVSK